MGSKVDFILERSGAFIEKNGRLFEKRQREGRIKDCHGDLHPANIFILADGETVIFDCIEFNKDFRFIDVASEIAFMGMDLDAFGREDFSGLFVKEYLAKTQDPELKTMLGIYKCYRANVRAKVAAIDWMQNKSEEAKERIRKYILLAERYAGGL
jgi:aminoglycoside phosphotransferase family enzyme